MSADVTSGRPAAKSLLSISFAPRASFWAGVSGRPAAAKLSGRNQNSPTRPGSAGWAVGNSATAASATVLGRGPSTVLGAGASTLLGAGSFTAAGAPDSTRAPPPCGSLARGPPAPDTTRASADSATPGFPTPSPAPSHLRQPAREPA